MQEPPGWLLNKTAQCVAGGVTTPAATHKCKKSDNDRVGGYVEEKP